MRASALVAQRDADGVERFRVTKPVDFTLIEAAHAMHAVVDRDLATLGKRNNVDNVGRSRVPVVLRAIARDGWPTGFVPSPSRIAFWAAWLVEQGVFADDLTEGADLMTLESEIPSASARYPKGCTTCVLNQKGGVGKTGLSSGLAGALAERGRRVLLVDLDPQGHLTTEALRMEEAPPEGPNLAKAMTGKLEEGQTLLDLRVTHSTYENGGRIDILPTTEEMVLVVKDMYLGRGRKPESVLQRLLNQLPDGEYDHVILDCPPALDIVTDNALVAAHGILIPVELARTSLRALRLLFDQINAIEEDLELEPRTLLGLVPSLFRRPLPGIARYVAGQLEQMGTPTDEDVEPVPIIAHVAYAALVLEAQLEGRTVVEKGPKTPYADAFRRIAIRVDVHAGLSPEAEWTSLPALKSLTVIPQKAAAAQ